MHIVTKKDRFKSIGTHLVFWDLLSDEEMDHEASCYQYENDRKGSEQRQLRLNRRA